MTQPIKENKKPVIIMPMGHTGPYFVKKLIISCPEAKPAPMIMPTYTPTIFKILKNFLPKKNPPYIYFLKYMR